MSFQKRHIRSSTVSVLSREADSFSNNHWGQNRAQVHVHVNTPGLHCFTGKYSCELASNETRNMAYAGEATYTMKKQLAFRRVRSL